MKEQPDYTLGFSFAVIGIFVGMSVEWVHVGSMTNPVVSNIGLLCDIFGASLVWRFGLSSEANIEGVESITTNPTDEGKRQGALYHRLSKIGIFLLVFGFSLQFIANLI